VLLFSRRFLRLLDSDLFLAHIFAESQCKVVPKCDSAHIFSFQLEDVTGQNSGLEIALTELPMLVGAPHVEAALGIDGG